MPEGRAYESIDELPEEFQVYSRDGQMAALDAYNGAILDGLATGEALQMAHQAAESADQGQETGQTMPDEAPPGPPSPGGPAAAPGGGGAGGLASALQQVR